MSDTIRFDHRGCASLDGTWGFLAGDRPLAELRAMNELQLERIEVPALWEAQGYLELDGYAWYLRRFELRARPAYATLRFGAVMDVADVYLNGHLLGTNDLPFTPFAFDVGEQLHEGGNDLAVRVFDPPVDHPEHIRSPHGKQGWANWVFPSRPSLYMTYGGIWQPVTLETHGPLVVEDVFINGDPNDLVVTAELRNAARIPVTGRLSIRLLGRIVETELEVPAGSILVHEAKLGVTDAPRWGPEDPVLHEALVDVVVDGEPSHVRAQRFGLRTIRLDGTMMLLNEIPYRMKSALVQGFRADGLYDEGSRDEIEAEVRAAREMGFNTLRLHIKAFDPRYLELCDELGMLLHCDIPVAEPIAHEELGADTELADRCMRAARAQVRRDRNHPSVILWSAMNELCYDRQEVRQWDGYEAFCRVMVAAILEEDPTRPVIENDWAEPDPDRVFSTPILTAHWYGRLHAAYLDKIEQLCRTWSRTGRPLYVTEFGDWGLPEMPSLEDPPFWDTRSVYAIGLAASRWPDTIERFFLETQRYQGLSDRLQMEVYRRHGHIGGYCLTELTDVPHELNGLLDLLRRPKPLAVREITRGNQAVLPMLHLENLVAEAGALVRAPAHVANDGPPLRDVTIEAWFGDSGAEPERRWHGDLGALAGYAPSEAGAFELDAPVVPGNHDLIVRLRAQGIVVAENRYPIQVVATPVPLGALRLLAGEREREVLPMLGAIVGGEGPAIVGEGALDGSLAGPLRAMLEAGGTAIVLAQPAEHAERYPVPLRITTVETAWGSSIFHFTTDHGALTSFPRRNVLVAEDSTIQSTTAIMEVDGQPFPSEPLVIAYKPTPGAMTGTVVGEHRIGSGRLLFCQYRLIERAQLGDPAARGLLADLVAFARAPRRAPQREELVREDGRRLWLYRFGSEEPR